MAKGVGQKTQIGMAPLAPKREGGMISVEEADRAASAFVPLWQFDEAPFAAGGKVPETELNALAAPRVTPIDLHLAPAPMLAAPAAVAAIVADAVVMVAPRTPATVTTAEPAPTSSEHDLLMSRATVRMTPAPHQPQAARVTDPELPSVIVDAPLVEPIRNRVTVQVRVPTPPPDAAPPGAGPPPQLREPKTDPPMARARPARPVSDADDAGTVPYGLPRSRTPLLVVGGIVGSALLILAVYAVSSAMSATPPPSTAGADTTGTPPPRAAAVPPHTAEPGVGIPPPPPPDDTPTVSPPRTPPVVAVAPPPVIPVATPAMLPPAPPPRAATPPSPPPRSNAAPPHRPATPRNPTPTAAPGGIVRDNPF
jgi:hypothetical protein